LKKQKKSKNRQLESQEKGKTTVSHCKNKIFHPNYSFSTEVPCIKNKRKEERKINLEIFQLGKKSILTWTPAYRNKA
jgi:hypothetical protein